MSWVPARGAGFVRPRPDEISPGLYGVLAGLLLGAWIALPVLISVFGVSLGSLDSRELLFYLPLREGLLVGFVLWLVFRRWNNGDAASRHLRALGQAYPGAVALVDQRFTVCFVNPAFLRLFRGARESFAGRHLDDALGPLLTDAQVSALLPRTGKARLTVYLRPEQFRRPRPLGLEIVSDAANGCWLITASLEPPPIPTSSPVDTLLAAFAE